MPTINGRNGRIEYEFRERLGTIPSGTDAWDKQLNLICWNKKEPAKFDIRGWSPEGDRMTKGITLYENEMRDVVRLYLIWKEQKEKGIDGKVADLAAREAALREEEARLAAEKRAFEQQISGEFAPAEQERDAEETEQSAAKHDQSVQNARSTREDPAEEMLYESESATSKVAEESEHYAAAEEEVPF